MSNLTAAAVVDRLLAVYGVKNDNQLSDVLDIKRSTLGNWRARDSVPYPICVSVAVEKGVSLDWLLTGVGPMYRTGDVTDVTVAPETQREQALLALFRELDEDGQRDIQSAAEEKKRLKSLEQRLKELEAVVGAIKKMA